MIFKSYSFRESSVLENKRHKLVDKYMCLAALVMSNSVWPRGL